MNALTSFASTPLFEAIGWTLLHFLWQGCLIAGVLAVGLRLLKRRSANARYAACCAAMLAMAIGSMVTFAMLAGSPVGWFARTPLNSEMLFMFTGESARPDVISTVLPYVVGIWAVGVAFLLVRLTGGWLQVQRVKRVLLRGSDGGWQETVDRLSRRLGLRSVVRIVESAAASVPTVIGWIRPIILMPAAAVCGMSAQQLEVVIAHELAHIRRHDYLVNLLQSVMETLLFYHPGVWWVSGRMREEREYCCDDMAVAVCGDPIRYAHVLTDLETLRGTTLHLGLSSTGGSLMNRVTRLVGLSAARPRRGSLWIMTAFALTAAAGITSVAGHSLIGASDDADAPKAVMVKLDVQTVGEKGEGLFVWVTPEIADGESQGVWVADEIVEFEATVQTHAVRFLTLMNAYDETAVEFVDEKEEAGGLSFLTLAHRYLSRFVADERGDQQAHTFIGHLEQQDGDDQARFGEATEHITFEIERGNSLKLQLNPANVQFGELHLRADQLEIEFEPTVGAGHLLQVTPIIQSGEAGNRIELHIELLRDVYEEVEMPLTVTFESLGFWGKLVRENGDGEPEQRLLRVYSNVVEPTTEVYLETDIQKAGSTLQGPVRVTLFERLVHAHTKALAEYHVLREIYVDAKEGEEAEVRVRIKVEVDESGDK